MQTNFKTVLSWFCTIRTLTAAMILDWKNHGSISVNIMICQEWVTSWWYNVYCGHDKHQKNLEIPLLMSHSDHHFSGLLMRNVKKCSVQPTSRIMENSTTLPSQKRSSMALRMNEWTELCQEAVQLLWNCTHLWKLRSWTISISYYQEYSTLYFYNFLVYVIWFWSVKLLAHYPV